MSDGGSAWTTEIILSTFRVWSGDKWLCDGVVFLLQGEWKKRSEAKKKSTFFFSEWPSSLKKITLHWSPRGPWLDNWEYAHTRRNVHNKKSPSRGVKSFTVQALVSLQASRWQNVTGPFLIFQYSFSSSPHFNCIRAAWKSSRDIYVEKGGGKASDCAEMIRFW